VTRKEHNMVCKQSEARGIGVVSKGSRNGKSDASERRTMDVEMTKGKRQGGEREESRWWEDLLVRGNVGGRSRDVLGEEQKSG